jgi:hypothetical protein
VHALCMRLMAMDGGRCADRWTMFKISNEDFQAAVAHLCGDDDVDVNGIVVRQVAVVVVTMLHRHHGIEVPTRADIAKFLDKLDCAQLSVIRHIAEEA